MKPGRTLLFAVLMAFALAARGQAPSPVEVELGGSTENLDKGLPDWSSVYLEAARTFRPRHALYGGIRQTRRFNQNDDEAYGGLYYPLGETWTAVVDGSFSTSHNVLPEYAVIGQLQKMLVRGLTVGGGVGYTQYTVDDVRRATGGIEYYWSSYRAAYTFYSSRVNDLGSAPAHRFQLNYYYTDDSSAGIAYATGREVESVGPPVGVVTSEVREWMLYGRHWFSRNWGLSWEVLDHEQGVLYRRQGVRVGLRHRF